MENKVKKGFIHDSQGNTLLPITRAELILDKLGNPAFQSSQFAAGGDNSYGLISKVDIEFLHSLSGSSGTTSSIQDILNDITKLYAGAINVNNTSVPFYNSDGASNINLVSGSGISIAVTPTEGTADTITVSLEKITNTTEGSGIVTGLEVDDYGRVTKVVKSSDLTGYVTTVADNSEQNVIVNKKYVDDSIAKVELVAVGALNFVGKFDHGQGDLASYINTILSQASEGDYMLVAKAFEISSDSMNYMYYKDDYNNAGQSSVSVNVGDTLIVRQDNQGAFKLIHIPSGNDTFVSTDISVIQGTTPYIQNKTGSVVFNFDPVFTLAATDNEAVQVGINALGSDSDDEVYGVIKASDYKSFLQASAQSVQYLPTINQDTPGAYALGNISFGSGTESTIYGTHNTYAASLESITDSNTGKPDPTQVNLKFASSVNTAYDTSLNIKGEGIKVEVANGALKLSSTLAVDPTSAEYLDITGNTLKIKTGESVESSDGNGDVTYTGLATYAQAVNLSTQAVQAAHGLAIDTAKTLFTAFTEIPNNLTEQTYTSEGSTIAATYWYGNDALVAAIAI